MHCLVNRHRSSFRHQFRVCNRRYLQITHHYHPYSKRMISRSRDRRHGEIGHSLRGTHSSESHSHNIEDFTRRIMYKRGFVTDRCGMRRHERKCLLVACMIITVTTRHMRHLFRPYLLGFHGGLPSMLPTVEYRHPDRPQAWVSSESSCR